MKDLTIYTDGSHFKGRYGSNRLGCGGVLVRDGILLDKFSLEVSPDFLKTEYGTSQVSNPTTEMLGVLVALRKFGNSLKRGDSVIIKADYVGVRDWCTGKWKTKEPYIKAIKEDILKEIKKLGINVSFEWVKGHQSGNSADVRFNNMVDLLAKGQML